MTSLSSTPPGVRAAQFRSFARRMPSYYASFVVMMIAIMIVFRRVAPTWLTYGVPLFTSILGILRGFWWFRHRDDVVSDDTAARILQRANMTLVAAAIIVVGMDVRLFSYGDSYTRNFLLVQMLSSATCGFYCLMHLRKTALAVFAVVMLPFAILSMRLGHASTSIAAATSLFTAAVMVAAMKGYEEDFFSLIRSRAETNQLSEENLRLAHLDMLTGLPNRRQFFNHLEACASQQDRRPAYLTVGIIDLDGFKPVNDTYGHRTGDRVLQVIAERLGCLQEGTQQLCRLGGDEFVFLTEYTCDQALHRLGQVIIESVTECVRLEGQTISVGCSVGFAVPSGNTSQDGYSLFEQADYALYHAKRTGRARTVIFSQEHETLIKEQGALEQALRNADIEAEFTLEYQPIMDLRTSEISAFECLARWNSPVLGRVPPMLFIAVAEKAGLIGGITQVLFRKALKAAALWPEHIHLSFNLSPHELASREHIEGIIDIIRTSNICPERVAIELTETALMNGFSDVRRHMEMIRETGASIYLDDFGTGHSSLSYIHTLPLDRIKIDRSFVQTMGSNPASESIIRSVISLCRDLDISCVIEGVETAQELSQVCELSAELIQGYYFSTPMPESLLSSYICSNVKPGIPKAIAPMPTSALQHRTSNTI